MSHHRDPRRRALRSWMLERMEERTLLSVLTVNTTDDADNRDGVLSLREAIEVNNGTLAVGSLTAQEQGQVVGDPADRNAIHFNIPGSGVRSITLTAALPTVSHSAEIDGTTQPGFTGAPIVELNGNGLSTAGLLYFTAPDSAVEGLVINNLPTSAIVVHAANFVLRGSYIGVNAAGDAASPVSSGVEITTGALNTLIEGNVISGCSYYGILNGYHTSMVVRGNKIGTNAAGTAAIPNSTGIGDWGRPTSFSSTVIIGGVTPGDRNVISGNIDFGVDGSDLVVQGNYIGTNADGTGAIPNRGGIKGGFNQIGGTEPGSGNLISGNTWGGITGDDLVIQGNLIGTDVTGSAALVPGMHSGGIGEVSGSLIGGTTPGARNVISGFDSAIVFAYGCTIQGNYIGLDATGEHAVPNFAGVDRVYDCTIGGTTPGAGNVISGNHMGIAWLESVDDQPGCLIQGNLIGTNQDGTRAIGNDFGIYQPRNGAIGGTTQGAGNLISGNNGPAIWITGYPQPTLRPITIQGNRIGTDITGAAPLSNGAGIDLSGGTSGVLIGGREPGSGNLIAYNTYNGVYVGDEAGDGYGNSVIGNSIHDNGGLGIDLGKDGVTLNDSPHTEQPGPNHWQDFPVLSAAYAGPTTYVVGTLHSTPNTPFTLDFYANPQPGHLFNGKYYGEGQTYLGSAVVTTAAAGDVSFTVPGLAAASLGQWISATATAPDGSTSEFAADVEVTRVPTTTTVSPSIATPLFGVDAVTFTATVGSLVAGLGTPTGSVQFAVDGTDVGAPVPLVGGVASFTTSALTVGPHAVSARYSGDAAFPPGDPATTNVTVIPPASLSGIVFSDFNNDGQVNFGEPGIVGVPITLTGTDDLGNPVNLGQATDSDGTYVFLNLRPGSYTITESQPTGYSQGTNAVGSGGGTISGDQFQVCLPVGLDAMNYNFGERPAATGAITNGQTAGIGFWNNTNGQALIKALNGGGASTKLGDWLAATFPNMFGAASAGNNLAGKDNASIASFFQSRFVVHGQKLDAQVLATALAVYVTSATLDDTGVGTQYGFLVGGNGVATATINVGANGAAFGVADNTVMAVMDVLLAADAQAVHGVLYNGNTTRRNMANTVFSAINQGGDRG